MRDICEEKEGCICYECVASCRRRTITFCIYLPASSIDAAGGFYPEKEERRLLLTILGEFFINENIDVIF